MTVTPGFARATAATGQWSPRCSFPHILAGLTTIGGDAGHGLAHAHGAACRAGTAYVCCAAAADRNRHLAASQQPGWPARRACARPRHSAGPISGSRSASAPAARGNTGQALDLCASGRESEAPLERVCGILRGAGCCTLLLYSRTRLFEFGF